MFVAQVHDDLIFDSRYIQRYNLLCEGYNNVTKLLEFKI